MDTIEFKLDLLNYINNYRERQYKTLYYNYYDETTIHNYNNLYIKYKILIYSYEKLRNKVKNDYNFFINNTISEFKYIHDLQIKDYKQLFFKYKQLQIELSFFNIKLKKLNIKNNNNNNNNSLGFIENKNKLINNNNNKLLRDIKILSIL